MVAMALRGAKVKGVALRTVDACFIELRGESARKRADAFLPPELLEAFRYHTVMASGWYAIEQYKALFHAFRSATGEGPELARAIGRLAARHDMAGVHKQILAKLISPQALLSTSARVFASYYDTGKVEVVETRRGFAHLRATGCLGWDQNMWSELIGSCEALLEISGAKHVRIRPLAGGKDDNAFLELEAHWV
jgi:hypothetical protein